MSATFQPGRVSPISRVIHALLRTEHTKRGSLDVALLVGLAEHHDRDRVELYVGDVRAVVSDLREQLDLARRQVALASTTTEIHVAPMFVTSRRLPRDILDRLRAAMSDTLRSDRSATGRLR